MNEEDVEENIDEEEELLTVVAILDRFALALAPALPTPVVMPLLLLLLLLLLLVAVDLLILLILLVETFTDRTDFCSELLSNWLPVAVLRANWMPPLLFFR